MKEKHYFLTEKRERKIIKYAITQEAGNIRETEVHVKILKHVVGEVTTE